MRRGKINGDIHVRDSHSSKELQAIAQRCSVAWDCDAWRGGHALLHRGGLAPRPPGTSVSPAYGGNIIHDQRAGQSGDAMSLAGYWRECSPIILPSVSTASAMKPYSPIDVFSFSRRPPACLTRAASTAQSVQLK
jgi:hypothetical protein